MLVNQHTAVSTSAVLLVPYEKSHVTTYHEWMKDEVKSNLLASLKSAKYFPQEIRIATASEALSLEEEYEMQQSWRDDHDKLTFIACLPLQDDENIVVAGKHDSSDHMIGDVNLFLSKADEDDEGCIGELELMIAPTAQRHQGYGRATILTFLHYIQIHLPLILDEYKNKEGINKMYLLQLKVKIGSKNEKSIKLFESIGFIKVAESANYFGEFELTLEGFLEDEGSKVLLTRYGVDGFREMEYVEATGTT